MKKFLGDTTDMTKKQECHEHLRMLLRLADGTISYSEVVSDTETVQVYAELVTSILDDSRMIGRSCDELFPNDMVTTYRETAEPFRGKARDRSIPGLWPDSGETKCGFGLLKVVEFYYPDTGDVLPVYAPWAQQLYIRLHLLPSALYTLRGYVRYYLSQTTEDMDSERVSAMRNYLAILDSVQARELPMPLFMNHDEEVA